MELKIQLYDCEDPTEDLLKWYLTVQKYFAMKPANTASEKFEIIPKCLSEAGSIQNMWATTVDEAIGLEEEDSLGVITTIGEDSDDVFNQAILRFFRNWMTEETGEELRRYLRFYLRKPPSLHPRDVISRMEALNRYFE